MFLALAMAGCGDDGGARGDGPGGGPDGGAPGTGIGAVEDLSPEEGWTIHIPPFEVPPATEITDCYFLAFPDLDGGRDVWIDRFKIAQRPGSHHMNVFRVNTVLDLGGQPGDVVRDGECKNLPNWADWPLVVNSQDAHADEPPFEWKLPDGVAQRFEPGELLMVQTHYVNTSTQPTPEGGEVKINMYRSRSDSPEEVGTLFATYEQIRICQSSPQVEFDARCTIPSPEPIHVIAANGHFHSRGERFDMYTWDGVTIARPPAGDRFYQSTSWDEPPMVTGIDEVLPTDGGIWWTCAYEWEPPTTGCDEVNERDDLGAGDCCYTFGNTAEAAEHCNVFVYYWPRVEHSSTFCD